MEEGGRGKGGGGRGRRRGEGEGEGEGVSAQRDSQLTIRLKGILNPANNARRKLRPKQDKQTLPLRHLLTHSQSCPSARWPGVFKEVQGTHQQ